MILGPVLACIAIVAVAGLLLKEYHPHAVLLVAGLVMLLAAELLGLQAPALDESTGFFGFDLFRHVTESFSGTLAGVGLMIMAIGGFVAMMDEIGASGALVRIATTPLRLLSRFPYVVAALVIPIGQVLFVCIPSAAGLGLLLMASVFPLLVRVGVSRLTAVSAIVACTSFGMGPASAMSAKAAELVGMPLSNYFFLEQIPLAIPASVVMAGCLYATNRWFDARAGGAAAVDAASATGPPSLEEDESPLSTRASASDGGGDVGVGCRARNQRRGTDTSEAESSNSS